MFCFVHYDLDGVITALVTKWAHPDYEISFKPIAAYDFRSELTKWLLHDSFSNYDKVFILDLDVIDNSDLVDKENVMIIDHHRKEFDKKKFKKAIVVEKEYSSACKLAYKVFQKLYNIQLTPEQKFLILLGDDYDSYKLDLPLSRVLNAIFWGTDKSFISFLSYFEKGFNGLTEQQEAIYNLHIMEVREILEKSLFFKGEYGSYQLVSTTADKHINDIAEHIIKKFKPDVAIVVNLKSDHISFRRRYDSKVDVSKIAEILGDGGGHEYSAGGVITKQFLEFTKTLEIIK